MGGTGQGDANMMTAGQDIARAVGAFKQRQLVGAQQGLSLTDQLPDDDPNRIKAVNAYKAAASRYYGRSFPGVPTRTVGGSLVAGTGPGSGTPATPGTPGTPPAQGQDINTGTGALTPPQGGTPGTSAGPDKPAQYTPTQTIPVVPHVDKTMTFGQLAKNMGWDRDGTLTDANGKPIDISQWANLPAEQVLGIDRGLRYQQVNPATGEVTYQGGLFPKLGPQGDKASGVMAQAQRFQEAAHQAFVSNDQAALNDTLTRATAWRNSLIQKDPTLTNVLPNFDDLRNQYGQQISNSTQRINIEGFRTDLNEAWQELRSAQQTGDRATIVNAYKNLQGVIQRGKQLNQPVLAGDQTPEQLADAYLNGPKGAKPQPPQTGQPIIDSNGQTWVPETYVTKPGEPPVTRYRNVQGNYYSDTAPTQAQVVGSVKDANGKSWQVVQFNRPQGQAPDVRYYNPTTGEMRPEAPAGAEPRLPAKAPVDKNGWGKMSTQDLNTWITQNGPWTWQTSVHPVTAQQINNYHEAVQARDAAYGLKGNGAAIFENHFDMLLDAVRAAEGSPSYGDTALYRQYGGPNKVPEAIGRAGAAQLIKSKYADWVHAGKPGDFLGFLSDRYNAEGGDNQSNWLTNVLKYLDSHPPGSQQPNR